MNCHYFTESSFSDEHASINDGLTFVHLNIRSLCRKFDDFKVLAEAMCSDRTIIGISETWFSSETDLNLFSLPGYKLIDNHRPDKKGGGVALYIPDQIDFRVCYDFNVMNEMIETLFVELCIPGKSGIMLGVVYRPPHGSLNLVMNEMQNILSNKLFDNKITFLMGDFNVNLLNHNENNAIGDFLNMMVSFSFMPLITKPTRVIETSATLIDNIFTTLQPFPDSGIIISDISDHFPVFAKANLGRNPPVNNANDYFRVCTPDNVLKLAEALSLTDWSEVISDSIVSSSFESFFQKFMVLYNENIPLCKRKVKNRKKFLYCHGLLNHCYSP